ncbi:MAG: nitroreductase/quinone reductase family protein [Acidimicrobiia bacterium]
MSALGESFEKLATRLHRTLFHLSKGRVFGAAKGMPMVELTTTGRKTGAARPVMVMAPVCEDDRVVVVASHNGAPRHPAWYLNLVANPEIAVTRAGRSGQPMTARTATGQERAELWARIVERSDAYAKAQTKTEREFPIVILTPKR